MNDYYKNALIEYLLEYENIELVENEECVSDSENTPENEKNRKREYLEESLCEYCDDNRFTFNSHEYLICTINDITYEMDELKESIEEDAEFALNKANYSFLEYFDMGAYVKEEIGNYGYDDIFTDYDFQTDFEHEQETYYIYKK